MTSASASRERRCAIMPPGNEGDVEDDQDRKEIGRAHLPAGQPRLMTLAALSVDLRTRSRLQLWRATAAAEQKEPV
jgi:hypothetical protein